MSNNNQPRVYRTRPEYFQLMRRDGTFEQDQRIVAWLEREIEAGRAVSNLGWQMSRDSQGKPKLTVGISASGTNGDQVSDNGSVVIDQKGKVKCWTLGSLEPAPANEIPSEWEKL